MYKIVPAERQKRSNEMITKNRCKPSKNGLQRSFLAPPAGFEPVACRLGVRREELDVVLYGKYIIRQSLGGQGIAGFLSLNVHFLCYGLLWHFKAFVGAIVGKEGSEETRKTLFAPAQRTFACTNFFCITLGCLFKHILCLHPIVSRTFSM